MIYVHHLLRLNVTTNSIRFTNECHWIKWSKKKQTRTGDAVHIKTIAWHMAYRHIYTCVKSGKTVFSTKYSQLSLSFSWLTLHNCSKCKTYLLRKMYVQTLVRFYIVHKYMVCILMLPFRFFFVVFIYSDFSLQFWIWPLHKQTHTPFKTSVCTLIA